MDFRDCINQNQFVLMEGALGERLKREYSITFDEQIAMAGLIYEEKGAFALNALWNEYLEIARKYELPFLATTPTRRANKERIAKANCPETVIADNVAFLKNIQRNRGTEMYVGGLMGCKGDAYTGEGALDEQEAYGFHRWTAEQFQKAGVDFLYAGIMPTLSEAAGLARAIDDTGLPYIISFTIQEDGKLIDLCVKHCHSPLTGMRWYGSGSGEYRQILPRYPMRNLTGRRICTALNRRTLPRK